MNSVQYCILGTVQMVFILYLFQRKILYLFQRKNDNVHILVFLFSIFRFVTRMNDTIEYLFVLLFIRKIPTFVSSR